MAIVLLMLAIGAAVAGYVGVPHALGGGNRIEGFLEPSFEAAGETTETAAAEGAGAASAAEVNHGVELPLMLVSTIVAFLGIGLATFLFLVRPTVAQQLAERFVGVHRVLTNKYSLDELPSQPLSSRC